VQDETLLETRSGRPKKGLSWKPILSESLTHIANDAINATSVELLKRERGSISPFEMCDIAVMCGYLEVVEPSAGWENIAVEYLNCAATRISANRTRWPALFDGIAACGWAFEHISQAPGDAMEEWQDISDPIEEIDSFLLKMLQERSWKWGYDLISGLVGLGVYFLERLPRASAIDGIQLILNYSTCQRSHGGGPRGTLRLSSFLMTSARPARRVITTLGSPMAFRVLWVSWHRHSPQVLRLKNAGTCWKVLSGG